MLTMRISNDIKLPTCDVPSDIKLAIIQDLTLRNPAYEQAVKMGRSTYNKPQFIQLFRETDDWIVMPRGYGAQLRAHMREQSVTCKIDDQRLLLPPVKFRSRIKLRPYQERAVEALLRVRQGGVVAPCGAGKTQILLEAIARAGQPTLWVTHTRELAEQVIDRAVEVLDLDRDEIGRIYGGQQTIGERFTVCLVQTLSKLDIDAIKGKFGAVLVDEAHHMAASTFYHPIGQFPALYRLWASATPERSDGLTDMVFAGAGPIVEEIKQDEVPTIKPGLVVVETTFDYVDESYTKVMERLVSDSKRNALITQTLAEHAPGHYSLVLSERIEHLQVLRNLLREVNPELRTEVLTGKLPKRQREAVMQRAINREIDVIFATQVAREGLDITHLDRLFLAAPKRADGAVQQEVGRIARSSPEKTDALVFDFWDARCPIVRNQFYARNQVYRRLGIMRERAV